MKFKNKDTLILSILIPLAVGSLSALFSGRMDMIMEQSALTPPAFIFPIVWTILYILMGISAYLIYSSDSPDKINALTVYALQLVFNFFWSIVFFRLSWYLFAFLWLVIMIWLIAVMIWRFYQISPLAAYLQLPYLLWCLFAAYLNFMVYRLN